MVKEHPIELAYALALVSTGDYYSITPPFVWRAKRDCKNPAFFIHATLFRFFHFSLLADCQEDNFSNHPSSTVFPPFFRRFSRESPAFWKPISEFFAKTWDFSKEIDTLPPLFGTWACRRPRGRGGRYGRTPQAMPQKRKWNEFIQSRNTTKTQLYFIYIFTKKFTPILWEWKVVFLQR